jgi:hypothetical protein
LAERERGAKIGHSREGTGAKKGLMGWIGTACLLAIIVVKLTRHLDLATLPPDLVGVLPSVLGPAGFLLLMRSSDGWPARYSLLQTTLVVGLVAVGLEVAQLLPRPGALEQIRYTFDVLDLGASLISVAGGYFLAFVLSGPRALVKSGAASDQFLAD